MNKKPDMSEFKQIEDLLRNTDVRSSQYEERIFNRLKYKIETETIKSNDIEKDDRYMKKKFTKGYSIATLTLAVLVGGVSITYGSEILSSIIARFQVGNAEITQYDNNQEAGVVDPTGEERTLEFMQEGFKGKLFDKNGNEALYGEHQEYYTADGKMITSMMVRDLPNGKQEFVVSTEDGELNDKLTLEEVKEVANSKIKLPSYIPQGYSFKEATTSFEGNGVYVAYENKSEETIVLLASATKEATSGVATTEAVTETTIDGKKVMVSGNGAFWESEDVTYQLYWNLENGTEGQTLTINMEEVSKIIESMK